jgi:hypothetical protein
MKRREFITLLGGARGNLAACGARAADEAADHWIAWRGSGATGAMVGLRSQGLARCTAPICTFGAM